MKEIVEFRQSIEWVNDIFSQFYGCNTELTRNAIDRLYSDEKRTIVSLYRLWNSDVTTELRYIVRMIETNISFVTGD